MDKEPSQVFVDVKFIATDMTDRYRMGIDWSAGITASASMGSVVNKWPFNMGANGWTSAIMPRDPVDADADAGISDFTDRSGPFAFGLLNFSDMTATLEMFKQDEGSELKQSPQLLVLDHEQACIFVGETIRFAETDSASNQSGGVETGIREATNSPVDTGFQLLLRPHIVPGENKVILTVIPKAETLSGTGDTIPGFDDFTNGVATIQLPRVQSSTLVTKLIMNDGQTAVLGGMIEESESNTKRKVPVLGDVPLLGWAFRWESKLKSRNNLLIFLTVRIVRNGSDVHEIYTQYGSKYGGKAYKAMQEEAKSRWNRTKGSGYGNIATTDQ
jgi:general secretion pathway protein D